MIVAHSHSNVVIGCPAKFGLDLQKLTSEEGRNVIL